LPPTAALQGLQCAAATGEKREKKRESLQKGKEGGKKVIGPHSMRPRRREPFSTNAPTGGSHDRLPEEKKKKSFNTRPFSRVKWNPLNDLPKETASGGGKKKKKKKKKKSASRKSREGNRPFYNFASVATLPSVKKKKKENKKSPCAGFLF